MTQFRKTAFVVSFVATLTVQAQYERVDKLALETKIQGITVEKLARFIEQQTLDENETVRFLFTFIANHVEYDLQAFQQGSFSNLEPDNVLQYRKAVCQGYCNLFEALCSRLGIRSQKISGLAKGAGFSNKIEPRSNHTWMAVWVNNDWKLIDPTWGAGFIHNQKYVKHFNPVYFFTPPHLFITNHLSEDPAFQLLTCVIKPTDFVKDSVEIIKLATQCVNPTYSYTDTLSTDYSLSEHERLLRQARRIAAFSEFGLLAAAVIVNQVATEKAQALSKPAPATQERIQQAKTFIELYTEAFEYARRSKSHDAKAITKNIERNISQLNQFIEVNEQALLGNPR